ncbi:MAG: formylglycine-generating enzyme family protein [Thiomargarita sp.]|nr:formylglycine-generating enzyme family protein [Thiomargarita sp.]
MATLKIFILAVIFVATSGALFSDFFKEHQFLTFLASVMAILASFYLIQDIYIDLKKGASIESEELQKQIAELQNRLDNKTYKETLSAGNVFRDRLKDGGFCQEMVRIPAGRFQMGDIQGGGASDEKPVHQVSVSEFAMGKYEVTVGEFRRFVNATGYKTEAEKGDGCYVYDDSLGKKKENNWRNPYFSQNDNQPVVCVSWNDAVAYAEWLSQQTGKEYRLPTEAEWEYAARAGTKTKYWWKNEIGQNRANCDGCGSRWDNKQIAPVGSFAANPFELYDTVGNVWEWVADPWHKNYKNAPDEGQVWETGADKSRRVLRGGSCIDNPDDCRTANRNRFSSDYRFLNIGFRVAARL